jgi:hypothetical protein
LDGGGELAIAGLPPPASDPAVSPDGARLAFIGPVNGSAGPWTSAIDGWLDVGRGAGVRAGWAVGGLLLDP